MGTATTLEREVKLSFESVEAARDAVLAAGATPLLGRRLQEDALLDTPPTACATAPARCASAWRTARAASRSRGPCSSPMKIRDELETVVGDGVLLLRMFEELGYQVWFRYEKYREEFAHEDVIVAIDETPVGVFVEIEGSESGITAMAAALGRSPADYILDSYRGLFLKHREALGLTGTDMVFDAGRLDDRPGARADGGSRHAAAPAHLVRAKAAAPVNGEPLARRTIRWLAGHGVRDLVLNLHHRPESIAAVRRRRHAISASASATRGSRPCSGPPAGRATRCRCCSTAGAWAGGTFVLVNGDTLTDVDLPAMLEQHRRTGALVTMALIPNPRPDKYGGVLLDGDGCGVTGFTRRGDLQPSLSLHRPAGRGAPRRSCGSRTASPPSRSRALPAADGEPARRGHRLRQRRRVQDIGTPADCLQTSLALAAAEGRPDRPRWGRNVQVAASASVTRTVLWDDVTVGAGAVLDRVRRRRRRRRSRRSAVCTRCAIVRGAGAELDDRSSSTSS